MEKLNALMESDEMKTLVEQNQEMINEISESAAAFAESIKEYVVTNPEIFMEAEVEDIKKNIRIFAEAAMAQFMTEITSIGAQHIQIVEPVTEENVLNDYL